MRDSICGEVPFAVAVRDAGIPVEAIMEVGTYPPDAEVPPHVHRDLVDIEEVVDATGTQVLEMREQGGPEAERFTVHGRQRYATLMIAFGDTLGTLVRNLAWTREGDGWKISQFAQEQAALHGWTRANYERIPKRISPT